MTRILVCPPFQIPIFTYPTSKQPYVQTGNFVTAGFAAAGLLLALAIGYKQEGDMKKAAREGEIDEKSENDEELWVAEKLKEGEPDEIARRETKGEIASDGESGKETKK